MSLGYNEDLDYIMMTKHQWYVVPKVEQNMEK